MYVVIFTCFSFFFLNNFCHIKAKSDLNLVESEENDIYFGVPLGALHFSSDGTSAEIYAADEFTIIFNHFYHNPKNSKCIAMMIGPPRKEDKDNIVKNHGILLEPAHLSLTKRYKRHTNLRFLEQFNGWPLEFDHLLLPSDKNTNLIKKNFYNNNVKIDATNNFSLTENSTKDNATHKTQFFKSNNTLPFFKQTYKNNKLDDFKQKKSTNLFISTSTKKYFINETNDFITKKKEKEEKNKFLSIAKPLILFQLKNRKKSTYTKNDIEELTNLNAIGSNSGESYSFSPLIIQKSNNLIKQQSRNNVVLKKSSIQFEKSQTLNQAKSNQIVSIESTTPLFYVIEDPRKTRKQRFLKLKKKLFLNNIITTTNTTLIISKNTNDFDSRFELPAVKDELTLFILTNGAKINQYKWIGLYNQCLKKHFPLINLQNVDPPKEEKIMPLSGWSHNITSYRVHILNCNTILIPGFTYDGKNTTSNTYFFVGIGKFPDNIERQMKAIVMGNDIDEPLRNYYSEDILLRLPKHFRTFDIDYISVYNTDEKKSFAHVNIPSLLVPPCAEN